MSVGSIALVIVGILLIVVGTMASVASMFALTWPGWGRAPNWRDHITRAAIFAVPGIGLVV